MTPPFCNLSHVQTYVINECTLLMKYLPYVRIEKTEEHLKTYICKSRTQRENIKRHVEVT